MRCDEAIFFSITLSQGNMERIFFSCAVKGESQPSSEQVKSAISLEKSSSRGFGSIRTRCWVYAGMIFKTWKKVIM